MAEEEDLDSEENIFVQKKERGMVCKDWVLLDSQSTVNQLSNRALFKYIRKTENPPTIHCNTGSACSTLKEEFGNMTVKHNPYGIANVLSLHGTKQRHKVTCDSEDRGEMLLVHSVISHLTMVLAGSLSQLKWRDSLKASRLSKRR